MTPRPLDDTPPAPVAPPAVTLVPWPAQDARRAELAAAGRPRLLVLDAGTPPPLVWDDLEDWVRSPADPVEVQARIRTLEARAATVLPAPVVALPSRPSLDADGIVRWAGAWVAVPPVEARLLALLLDPLGEVVRRDDLVAAGWPQGLDSDRTLDGRIKLLRRRLAPLGLVVRTVRGVGFLLEAAPR